MSTLDRTVARVLDHAHGDSGGTDDEDALIEALEQESERDVDALRERRFQQLHAELARSKLMRDQSGTGTYQEVKDERTVMDTTTSTKLCVVHFFKSDFNRCRIMDSHLEKLALKHFDTRFIRINVENSPFLNAKLGIQILPTLIAFVNGVTVDRIVGFEGLGQGMDNFKTWQLETRLLGSKVLKRSKMTETTYHQPLPNATARIAAAQEEDDEWD